MNSKCSALFVALALLFTLASCGGTKTATSDANTNSAASADGVKVDNATLTLADYLRRVPGLQVSGNGNATRVMIRGGGSLSGNNSPLYVLDGTQIGNDYAQAASMVDVNDIKSVRVLKDGASTSQYGLQGSAGVVLITTKKGK